MIRRRPEGADLSHADDAEERNGSCRDRERQRSRGPAAPGRRADAALPGTAAAAALEARHRREGLRLDPDRAARGRLGPRRRPLPLRPRDDQRDRAAHGGRQGDREAPCTRFRPRPSRPSHSSSATTHAPAARASASPTHARTRSCSCARIRRRTRCRSSRSRAICRCRSTATPTTALKTDRINSAWSTCRNSPPDGTLETVQKLTGLSVNYLITINFHGFKLLVNKLHGVYMQVDHRYINTAGWAERLRDDRPRAGLPAPRRPAGARLRPLPAHRLRRLPARAPAALPRSAQGPHGVEHLDHERSAA